MLKFSTHFTPVKRSLGLIGSALGRQFIGCQLLSGSQGVGGTDLHIGFYAFSLPITFRNRVDGTTERNTDGEVVTGRQALNGMGTAACGFAHDGGTFLGLQIKRELFAA